MPYCPRCGNKVSEDAEYCTKCRTLLKEDVVYRPVRKRDEKDEKGEDDRYGHIIGGLIVIWLGVLLMLINQNLIRAGDFGGFFLMGIGVILVFRGLLAFQETGSIDQGFGFFIGGGILLLIGAGIAFNLRDWWAILLIGIGLVVVIRGINQQRRNPVP